MSDEKNFLPRRLRIYCPDSLDTRGYVTYYDHQGKRCRVCGDANQAPTNKIRRQRLEALRDQIIADYVPELTLEEKVVEWLERIRPEYRLKTYYEYRSKSQIFLRFLEGREVTREVVTEFFEHLDKEHQIGNSTRNDYWRVLRRVINQFTKEDFFDHIQRRRFVPVTKKHFQRHQIAQLRDHLSVKDPDLWFCCQCVYYLFIRPNSELRLLKVMHFEIDDWRVNIPPHISKTARNEYVMIPQVFRAEVLQFVQGKRPGDYLFPGLRDPSKPIGTNTFMGRFRRELNLLGYGKGYSLYSWKNTGALACIKAGIHVKYLQLQLRHSSLEMTDRYLKRMGIQDMGTLVDDYPAM